jgi:D-3-phosphoglycerate dehydrogenase
MNKYTVLITARSFAAADPAPLGALEEAACRVIRVEDISTLALRLREADGVIAGLEPYPKEILRGCDKLKVISRYGVGYDAIDLQAARQAGIAVTVTPGANSDSVADLAVALMLAAARHIPYMDAAIKSGRSERPSGVEMWQKTLGVIGTGHIGKAVIRRASGFEMRILCYSRTRDETVSAKYGGTYVDLDSLLAESDFITIHVPLTDKTRGLIGSAEFKKMKRGAILVNTAREGIIDGGALYTALKNGDIAAAALDTAAGGTSDKSPLYELPNCIITPHAGAATGEAALNTGMAAVSNLLDILRTGNCKHRVN